MLRDRIIAVTGSSGFIGSKLVQKLIEMNADVICLDISEGIDITDWQQIKNTLKIDCLYHLAAKTFVPESYKSPREFYVSNIVGTTNILDLCRRNNSKIVYVSSYVYGMPKYLPIDEKHEVHAFNPYSTSKIVCESLCEAYHRDYGLPVIIFRPFNVYGISQREDFLIPSIINQLKTGKIILKDPFPKRDFIYVEDVVDALIKSIYLKEFGLEIFNIGSGISYGVREIVDIIVQKTGVSLEVKFTGERRKGEILDTVADISKAKKILGWNPKVEFHDGIERIINHKLY